jgi:hypothetical protein
VKEQLAYTVPTSVPPPISVPAVKVKLPESESEIYTVRLLHRSNVDVSVVCTTAAILRFPKHMLTWPRFSNTMLDDESVAPACVCVCMYVYIYIYIYVCVCVSMCIYTCSRDHGSRARCLKMKALRLRVCVYVCMCIHTHALVTSVFMPYV